MRRKAALVTQQLRACTATSTVAHGEFMPSDAPGAALGLVAGRVGVTVCSRSPRREREWYEQNIESLEYCCQKQHGLAKKTTCGEGKPRPIA